MNRPIVTLANGQPAYTRGGFITEQMIRQHGSYAAARAWMAQQHQKAN